MRHIPLRALISGASSGIGQHCAMALARLGWQVIATVRKETDATVLRQAGLTVLIMEATDSASVQQCAAEALRILGDAPDLLFCNAGVGVPGAVEDLSRDALRFQFETNVFGTIELINALLPAMRARGSGRIAINSSILGFAAMPYRGAYNASKFALEGFADTLRQELIGSNIEVGLIEPGPITSRFRPNAEAQFDRWIKPEQSFHRLAYAAMKVRLAKPAGKAAPFTQGPEAVLDALLAFAKARKPKARYAVTTPTKVFWYLKRILPTVLLDRICLKASGDEPGYAYGRKHPGA